MAAFRKSVCKLLILSAFVVLFFTFAINVFAADGVTVDIVSFTRGAQADLRSSELLEAKVDGYDGNVRELTYKWTNTLGTYLYVYNSHNMYGINNTDGEIEIYNQNVSSSSNMSGRSYRDSYTGVGFAWAAVYGASVSSADLVGSVTVEVYDKDGNFLASDTHTGTRERTGGYWFRPTYTNYGFVASDLAGDVSHISFGLFEGDTKNVKILLGESSIVHITCVECSVSEAEIVAGEDIVEVVFDSSTQEYHIKSVTGVEHGYAEVRVTIEKGNCKFHQNYSSTKVVSVYVYNKPVTTSTSTVITLDDLDDDCTYYIDGAKGVRKTVDGKKYVVFEGLTPNTQYQIEVVGQAENTEPVYAYVYETTKPAHTGTVKVFLNGTYDTSLGTATGGTLVDIETVMPEVETLYLRYEDSQIYFPLERSDIGVYSSVLSDGNYTLYYSTSGSEEKIKLGDQILTINGASRTRDLFFNSVTYDTNGGSGTIPVEYYLGESKVLVTDVIPEKEGYLFTHWSCQDNHIHKHGETLTEAIGKEYSLVAQYVESFDVYVDIVIKHICVHRDEHNNDNAKHDITFTVDQRFDGSGDYTDRISKSIDWDGLTDYSGTDYDAEYVNVDSAYKDRTIYTAKEPTLVNVAKDAEYTFTTVKSGYALESVDSSINENGDLVLTATLIFDPLNFDFKFDVELDEKSMEVDDELKPVAVNVKVIAWGNPIDDDSEDVMWWHIAQMHDTYERIVLDENGKGTGTFPVWMATTDEPPLPYSYRIEVVSYETADGTIIPAINQNGEHKVYATALNRYSAEVFVEGGNTPSGSNLSGAYYDSASKMQNGTVKAVVTIDVFDVTFVPNGGTLNGSEENLTLNYQIGIPDLSKYVPTRDGGYVFDGWWYTATEDGVTVEKQAVSGTIIFEDTTLVAKWREPLTIKGNVAVAGAYVLTDEETGMPTYHIIPDHDRIKTEEILLQRINANGYAETVSYITIPLEYVDDYGLGTYEFSGIADDGHNYRVKVVSPNYHTHYLNETLPVEIDDYAEYTENMYMAEFADDKIANVHLYLHFQPENFSLEYEIDATAVSDFFRPTVAEVLVLCDTGEHIDPQHWEVISQMVHGDIFKGNENEMVGGRGSGSENVWNVKPDGVTPYSYSIRINSLLIDGETVACEGNLPFAIYYNGSARYSDLSGEQTQMLTATIVPRMYTITFDMGNLKEGTIVENMTQYATTDKVFRDTYYWSFGSLITASPKAEGYTFLGWYDEDGNRVTSITADSAENVTLTAQWLANVSFEVLADAGYYSTKSDSADKDGVIALNARISNLDEVKNIIDYFGIYIYDATGSVVKATVQASDKTMLEENNGEYHVLISDIDESSFNTRVLAVPFVLIGEDIVMGDSMIISVSDTNKWLGEKCN